MKLSNGKVMANILSLSWAWGQPVINTFLMDWIQIKAALIVKK